MSTKVNTLEDPLKIVVFPSDKWGCGYYRMILPGVKLANRGHLVCIKWDYSNFPMDADIYHFQRITTNSGLEAMKMLKKLGKVVMMDMDDDLFHLYPGHPSSWYFRKGYQCRKCGNAMIHTDKEPCPECKSTDIEFQDRLKICGDAFGYIDYLTVSTPELKERFGQDWRSSLKSVIIPNFIDMEIYENVVRKGDDYTAVGWFGSFTHTKDLMDLHGSLDSIIDYPENVIFMTAGENSDNMRSMLSNNPMVHERVHEMAPVELEEYAELLSNIDIGLAPIRDNIFNRSKSELKAIEYGAVGCPAICSDVAPYSRYIEHGVNGFLVKKNKEWKKYIKMLLDDPELRVAMGQANKAKARTMDINTRVAEREEFYLGVRAKSRQSSPKVQKAPPFILGGKNV